MSDDQDQSTATDGATAPTFADLGLDDAVLKALRDVGYETPSAIQAATIPPLLAGRDVVGLAQTGTGKTAAFALPILSRLDLTQKTPQALVLAPTRELALQVCEAFEKYAAHLQGRARAARLRRPGVRRAAVARCAAACTSSSARPAGSWTTSRRARSTCRAALPRARRGRRDAQDGLRRGRRDDPRRHPRRQAGRAVLRDDAGADPPDLEEVPRTTRSRSPSRPRRRRRPTSPSAT